MDHLTIERHALLLVQILDVQQRILARLDRITESSSSQEWYSPAEVAQLVNRKPSTIRAWCRDRRINARKRMQGRGGKREWELSADELKRFREHGLLPEVKDDC